MTKAITQSDEQRFEVGNDIKNHLLHSMERFEQRLTLNNLRLADSYTEQKLRIVVRFHVGQGGIEFVVCFQRAERVSGAEDKGQAFEVGGIERQFGVGIKSGESLKQFGQGVESTKCRTNGNQQAVFVDIVKSVELPERIIPTLVWFERVDSFNRVRPHTLYFSRSVGFVLRGAIGVGNRETGLPVGRPTSDDDKMVSQVVKGAPKVIKDVAGNERERKRCRPDANNIIDQLSCLRIALGPDLHPENWNKTNVKNLLEFGPPKPGRDHEKIKVHRRTSCLCSQAS